MTNDILQKEVCLPHKHISVLGKEVCFYREVSSTNNIARYLASNGAPANTIVLSSYQAAGRGRGRMNRQWVCPPGKGLLMSLILRPEIDTQAIAQLTLLCAVVVAETIKTFSGCAAGIKWPNDILIGGKKVCGILAEANFLDGRLDYVVIGLGINVNLERRDLPADCRETSTSLKIEQNQTFSRFDLLRHFISIWDKHYQGFLNGGYSYLRPFWLANNITLGRVVNIIRNDEIISGEALDINEQGGLMIRLKDGNVQEFLAEDVSLGRNFYAGN